MLAAGVGAGLGLVLWLAVILITRFYLQRTASCQQSSLSCLAVAAVAVGAVLTALAVLAWPLLRTAGVRPAWPVALAAPPVAFILGRAYQAFTGNFAGRAPDGIVILMVAYAVAALLTKPGARRAQTIALTAVIIALYPAASLWASHRQLFAPPAHCASNTGVTAPVTLADSPPCHPYATGCGCSCAVACSPSSHFPAS